MMINFAIAVVATILSLVSAQNESTCQITTQHLSDPPYENFFYSDCNVDAQAVVTSPLPDSNLSIIGPRLIVAWPAGNSGTCIFFEPQNGQNGSLAIQLVNSTYGSPLGSVLINSTGSQYPSVGVQGVLSFNTSAELTIAILGSVRTIRDFTEGPSLLQPIIQNANRINSSNGTGVSISRLWLDNVTTTTFTLTPFENDNNRVEINADNKTVSFGSGFYRFSTYFNYPQLEQLTPQEVLNNQTQDLIIQEPSQTTSLSFLSYTEKLLAGAWRFLTYFGRDSMISALLLESVLSVGNGSAIEAVIGAVLERINQTDGSVCHEETIGDYATYLNLQKNITSIAAGFTYPMIDTDFYLPILMASYFSKYPSRVQPLLSRQAGSTDPINSNLTYGQLALINSRKIMNITAGFVSNQTIDNLIHLKPDEIVGQWRDSTYGLANGRIPFDVNCALVPAALHAISTLASLPGIYPNTSTNNYSSWTNLASANAKVWEDNTLAFFQYNLSLVEAADRVDEFTHMSTFYSGPTHSDSLSEYSNTNLNGTSIITSYALSLNGSLTNSTNPSGKIPIVHTDTGFRLFLLNTTNDAQLTTFLNATANEILRPFPAGLMTPQSLVVANPALSADSILIANFTNSAYHGTVVWSWQVAMMTKGLERQLSRCITNTTTNINANNSTTTTALPAFCTTPSVHVAVRAAYTALWDSIDANEAQLQSEVWSWMFDNDTGDFRTVPLGALPPPPGVSAGTESNVRQLWSLGFLGVTRNEELIS